jgi:hypothetical protein
MDDFFSHLSTIQMHQQFLIETGSPFTITLLLC